NILTNIKSDLEELGTSLDHLIRLTFFVKGPFPNGGVLSSPHFRLDVMDEFFAQHCSKHCSYNNPPPSEVIGVAALAHPDLVIEIVAGAAVPDQACWERLKYPCRKRSYLYYPFRRPYVPPMVTQASPHARRLAGRIFLAGRQASLSAQIVADTRHALIDRKLKPGDFFGTEKDIAARSGVSRIVARDALRSLEALGIVEIRMGKGGGARVAHGNPRLFAEALAVQLDLTGVTAAEIMDAQRAI